MTKYITATEMADLSYSYEYWLWLIEKLKDHLHVSPEIEDETFTRLLEEAHMFPEFMEHKGYTLGI